ncbi:MAG: ABC transporter substrate-binding protein [Clostridia bacterium]|nr:ABC transporter substrate-binding protein [Clostridia bacterium]
MKKFLTLLLAVVMVASCAISFASCQKSGAGFTTDADGNVVVKIGCLGPLTGDYAIYGTAVKNGAQIAVDELNAKGAFEGIKFELLFEDSQGDGTKAVNAFGKLQDDGMNVSLGGVLSGETKNIVATAAESGVLLITPSASALDCIGEDNAFRVCFNDPQQGECAAQTIKDKNMATKIALFYDNGNDYCVGNITTFKAKAAELGLEIVTEQTYTSSTNTDFSTQITAIKENGAELVFMPIYYSDAAKFLRQASGKLDDLIIFGVDGLDGLIDECGAEYQADCEDVILLTPFYADATDDVTKGFVDAYKAKFDGATPNQFAADGYDAVLAIAEAMKKNAFTADQLKEISAEDFNSKMVAAMTEITLVGSTGTMTWVESGETNKQPRVLQIKSGKYVEYTAG